MMMKEKEEEEEEEAEGWHPLFLCLFLCPMCFVLVHFNVLWFLILFEFSFVFNERLFSVKKKWFGGVVGEGQNE